jgi:[CysO sulfur-carrier protein]-S-L-cysteine hydrolase
MSRAVIDSSAPWERLRLPAGLADTMLGELRAAYPNEGCGLLATPLTSDLVCRVYPVRNIATSPRTRYEGEPFDLVHAFLDMEARGWRLGAIYHSHPVSPAFPSAEDLRRAYYPSALTLIVSFQDLTRPVARLFSLAGGAITERPLVIEAQAARV